MKTEEFLDKLKRIQILPGVKAHQKMMPRNRPFKREQVSNLDEYRFSAVGIICYSNASGEIEFILIERPEYEGAHSGQMAFPGGKVDAEDASFLAAAKREVWEEVGISIQDEIFVLELTEMLIPVSMFIVKPFLFYLPYLPELNLSAREVKEVYGITIDDLLDNDSLKHADIKMSDQMLLRNVPYFDLKTKIVWGATAVILSELKDVLK